MNPQQTQAFVNKVFGSSGALAQGRLRRYNLRHALDNHCAELSEILEVQEDEPARDDSIQDAVLRVLESNENGIITNNSFKDAVLTVVRERNLRTNGSDI